MSNLKILIVEDEAIIAEDIKIQLIKLGYQVTGIARNYNMGLKMVEEDPPDIVLVDIRLEGTYDGIDLVQAVKEKYDLPAIFLTSHADKATVEKAKKVKPEGYLLKPFKREDLYTSIEIAFTNYIERLTDIQAAKVFENDSSPAVQNSIFVKKDHLLIKIRFDELKWIRAERNYVELHCDDKMHLTRSTLREILDKLPQEKFIQVQRSYAVNIDHITAIEFSAIFIGNTEIPVGRSYLDTIRRKLDIEF
jgi:two-component system response regulator LytT